ncbi:MAG: hypothetical protein ACE5H1_00835 [Thermodesulfobacteriota bacterium]
MFDEQDFSEERYRALLKMSLKQGYKPIFFGEEKGTKRFILWRHDVDLELNPALKMGRIEAEERIRSTYFLMTRSWFYNLFTKEGEFLVQKLLQFGHQVGLHCDLGVARGESISDKFVTERVHQDFSLITTFFGRDVFKPIVSFHNPPQAVFKRFFPGFYSTYSEHFFDEIKYLSDSNRIWREGPIEDWLSEDKVSQFSILLHPFIWAYGGKTMPEAISYYLKSRTSELHHKLEEDDIYIQ